MGIIHHLGHSQLWMEFESCRDNACYACRTGGVFVNGSIANANIQGASSGTVYLLGLNGTLLLNLADAASNCHPCSWR